MNKFGESGLLERVQNAIQPLAAEGKFQLEAIEYGCLYGDIDVRLCSENLDIKFHKMLRASSGVHCFFKVKSVKKTFSAKYLFPALNIDIRINRGKSLQSLDYNSIADNTNTHQQVIDALLERAGFIPELSRLCIEINERLQEICAVFSSENLGETINLYSNEIRKHEMYGRIF